MSGSAAASGRHCAVAATVQWPCLRRRVRVNFKLKLGASGARGGVGRCAVHARQSRPSGLSVVSRVLYTVDHLGWSACRSCPRWGASWARLHRPNAGRVQCAGELCTKPLPVLPVATQGCRSCPARVCCARSAKPPEPTDGRVQGPRHRRPCGLGRLPVVSKVRRIVGQAA